jgi:hypothetical protein
MIIDKLFMAAKVSLGFVFCEGRHKNKCRQSSGLEKIILSNL